MLVKNLWRQPQKIFISVLKNRLSPPGKEKKIWLIQERRKYAGESNEGMNLL